MLIRQFSILEHTQKLPELRLII